MVANHQQLRFDLFKRFESYGLALNCNHHLARKLQRLDNWAFEIQKGEVQMVLVSFAYQITTMKILQKGACIARSSPCKIARAFATSMPKSPWGLEKF
ncbi:hypothetical protein POPTR_015G091750v4 [Populus trichocarpa]|uniref:Uncharacterized protein n=1 Tax=Populus trichocarpa TaxID=3694 RepID=A0A3N7HMR6_POPTR|nr:hypothetical protein BDE02_15G079400 [Populus trichocarpa]RQP00799.1 hypothetical protein POPTR_015G091750v4 [Populus trichocarpa]